MALNFVKFQRGSQEAYNKLKANHRIEEDALYFIYDKQAPDNGGLLYLGEILIGGSGLAGATQLVDLLDINISGDILEGSILQYNNLSKKWTPISIKTAIENANPNIVSVSNGKKLEIETVKEALQRIDENPNTGNIVFINGNPYIFNGKDWEELIGTAISDKVSNLENRVDLIESNIEDKIAEAIAKSNNLIYKKLDTLPTLPVEDEEVLKNTIFLISKENPTDDNAYDEYMFIEGQYEKIGVLGSGNLDDYITTDTFNTTVGTLQSSINSISTEVSTLSGTTLNLQTISNNLTSKVNSIETQVGSLQTQVNGLSEIINNLQPISGDFVTKSEFNTTVGDLNQLLTNNGKESTTIVEEIIDLQNQVQWHIIAEE